MTAEEVQAEPAQVPADRWRPPARGAVTNALIVVLMAGAILAILYAWQLWPFAGTTERTDDAYVRGETTVISPQVGGYVAAVPVRDFQQVHAGQVLVRIDDQIYRARVEQARATMLTQMANLNNADQARRAREASERAEKAAYGRSQAELERARADMRRVQTLVSDGSVSRREADQTRAGLRQAQAQVLQAEAAREVARQNTRTVIVGRSGLAAAVAAAQAQVRLAQIDLAHTVVVAPEEGQLSEIGVRNGQLVSAGSQLMFLVPRRLWVIANFREAQTRRMQVGQRASLSVDALGGKVLTGRLESLAPAAGSEFAVLKSDNATGNFVKVAQRLAARIMLDPGQPDVQRLRPGLSVVARIDTATQK